MKFEGKVALITGAGSGIGRATAIRFAERGGRVAVADVNGENAAKVADNIMAGGDSAIAIEVDIAKPSDIEAMVARMLTLVRLSWWTVA